MNKNIFRFTIGIIFCILLSSCTSINNLLHPLNLKKTGTLADEELRYSFLSRGIKQMLNNGEIIVIPTTVKSAQDYRMINKDGKYVKEPTASFQPEYHFETIKEEKKKSSITGREENVKIKETIKDGYSVFYTFKIKKQIVNKIKQIKLEILNTEGFFELIHDKILTEKEKEDTGRREFYVGTSNMVIKGDNYIHGDRSYVYVFKLTLLNENNEVMETVNFFDTSRSHDRDYRYTRGFLRR